MKYGEQMEKLRIETGLSLNKLAEITKVSSGYVSKLKNNPDLIPSSKVVFNMAKTFKDNNANKNDVLKLINFLKDNPRYIKNNDFKTSEELENKIYAQFVTHSSNRNENNLSKAEKLREFFTENRIFSPKKSENVTVIENIELDEPIFDLEWLLTQERFNLFYGKEYITNPDEEGLYNQITQEDKKVIAKLIKAYFSSKYEKDINFTSRKNYELKKMIQTGKIKTSKEEETK